jgi:hypothetical protein
MTDNERKAYAIALGKKAKHFETHYPLVSSMSVYMRLPKDVQDAWVASGPHTVPVGDYDVHCELGAHYWASHSHNNGTDVPVINLRVRFVTTKYDVEVHNEFVHWVRGAFTEVSGNAIEALGDIVVQMVMDLETKVAQEQIHLYGLPYVVR